MKRMRFKIVRWGFDVTERICIIAINFQLTWFLRVVEVLSSMLDEVTLVDFKYKSAVLQRFEFSGNVSDVFFIYH